MCNGGYAIGTPKAFTASPWYLMREAISGTQRDHQLAIRWQSVALREAISGLVAIREAISGTQRGHQLAQRAISGALLFTYSTSRSSARRIRLSSIEKEVNWPGRL
jgi:hypothetical protein